MNRFDCAGSSGFVVLRGVIAPSSAAFPAQRARGVRWLHNLADAVGEKPRGLHAAIEGPLNLAGRDTLLAAADKLDGLKPQVKREMAILEDRADPHGEGLAAGVALPQAGAAGLASQAANALLVTIAAMRANRAFRPQVSLDIGESGFLIVKIALDENRLGHRESPMASNLYRVLGL
jgi:hypothetical protein